LLEEREQHAMLEETTLIKDNPHPLIVKIVDDFLDNSGC
jgi:hypothetical protein